MGGSVFVGLSRMELYHIYKLLLKPESVSFWHMQISQYSNDLALIHHYNSGTKDHLPAFQLTAWLGAWFRAITISNSKTETITVLNATHGSK